MLNKFHITNSNYQTKYEIRIAKEKRTVRFIHQLKLRTCGCGLRKLDATENRHDCICPACRYRPSPVLKSKGRVYSPPFTVILILLIREINRR